MEQNSMATNSPATERDFAHVPQVSLVPRQMQVERSSESISPTSFRYPEVRGGICEYCGVLDANQPSQYQYKLCPHYRGLQLRCTYCPASKDPDDIIYHSNLKVASHPDNPSKLVIWCDSFECSRAHEKRFSRGAA